MIPAVLTVAAPGASQVLDGAGGRLAFYAFRETTGVGAAVLRLWDGSNNGGNLLLPISLNPNESIREIPGMHTLPYQVGLFLEVVSGQIEGQVTTVPLDYGGGEGGLPVFVVGSVDLTVNATG